MAEKNLFYHDIFTSLESKLFEESIGVIFKIQSKVYIMKLIKIIVNTWRETFCSRLLGNEIAYTYKKRAVFQKYESPSPPFFFFTIPV